MITAIVPHLKCFGGVRRFLEVGNVLVDKGYQFRLWSLGPQEEVRYPLPWFDFRGGLGHFVSEFHPEEASLVLMGDPPSFPVFNDFPSNIPKYAWVIAGGQYLRQYRALYDVRDAAGVRFLVNNRIFLENFPDAEMVEGGVNHWDFTFRKRRCPECGEGIRVGYYAGRGRIKGEETIVSELKDLAHIELVPLSGIKGNEALETLFYHSLDYFVVWEQRPGWSNTAAEALACGVPVVSNGINVEPFRDRCIIVDSLRDFFTNPMGDFSWDSVVDRLISIWKEDGAL